MRDVELGSFIVANVHGTHTAVVLKLLPPFCIAAYGTSKDRDIEPRVKIARNSIAAKVGGLTADTFFYPTNVVLIPLSEVLNVYKRCPPNIREELVTLVDAAASTVKAMFFQPVPKSAEATE